jgi:hypothetical protein
MIIYNKIIIIIIIIIIILYKYCTINQVLYKEMWSAHRKQSMNTYIMFIARTSKPVPI